MKRFTLITFLILVCAMMLPAQAHAASSSYAALGDSIAAGAGLANIDPTCDRSQQAYPYSVAQSTGLSLSHYACSGAKVDEGIYGVQERNSTTLPAQLDQAYMNGTPSLITMTIGANDTRWMQFIRQCYYIRCGYSVDTARFNTYLIDLKLELNVIMAKIHRLSNGNPPQVIVTGYYDPLSYAACSDTSGLTPNEISWLKNRVYSLNNAIMGTITKYSYADYMPVSFAGHELCSTDSWVQSPSSAMPFHPTASGQQAIANTVLAQYNEPTQYQQQRREESRSIAPISNREKILNWYERFRNEFER